ncbi:hypothetical protein M5X11_08345 [Paenibacillus alginolyticus]|uniref:hypothetical protein n=1 Tax=Paenibacillus alginolyticus TaxID=59839 RepID=UPI0003FA6FB0|nr:hypothetical protein [Paenibacillus alginolyticus]MCY9664964.1 hypothetical protein [Paenibacillus alginolyticus]
MKKIISTKNGLLIILLISIIGCSKDNREIANVNNDILSYEQFKETFIELKSTFNPSPNFTRITPDDLVVRTTSFPDNNIDSRKADVNNNNIKYPSRYETYYKSETSDLFIKVNFVYLPQNNNSSFLSINTISNIDNSNIIEKYRDINRPLIDEYFITLKGMLIIINFIDNSDIKDNEDDKYKKFIKEELDFYKSFEKNLLESSKNNHGFSSETPR